MDQTINIADLVKPKFQPGKQVWAVYRDYRGAISHIEPIFIEKVGFRVEIAKDREGNETRVQVLSYYTRNERSYPEDALVASLNDLPEADRTPR